MRRFLASLAALAAALIFAPAALALNYTVNDPGDAGDAAAMNNCATAQPGCTLRAAIKQANVSIAIADTIDFSGAGQAPAPAAALDPITSPLTINGAGTTTITFGGAAAGPLIDVQVANTTLRSLTITGGASGDAVKLGASGDRLDTVTIRNTPGIGVRAAGDSVRVDSSRFDSVGGNAIVIGGSSTTVASPVVTGPGSTGIVISGASAAVTSPDISGRSGDGITALGNGARISGGRIDGNGGNGVTTTGTDDAVSRTIFFANGGRAIANGPGANGGIDPPASLRIGPRRADGSLPLTGNASGSLELWSGDPSGASEPALVDTLSVSGDFSYNFAAEPAPGRVFAASVTQTGLGSSEFATVAVPSDVDSPSLGGARALDTQTVRIDPTEPVDPASVQKEDFTLTMAGAQRTIDSVSVAPDGSFITLASSGWRAGEAGYVDLGPPGAITDAAGNASLVNGLRLRVLAAPGDFIAPLGAKLAITPKSICLTRGRQCRKPGMTIKFLTTEAGKATMVVQRGNVQIGKRLYGNIVPGSNTLKFNGRLAARKLRAGRYRLLMYLQDPVGNVTDQPPIQLFTVRRTTK